MGRFRMIGGIKKKFVLRIGHFMPVDIKGVQVNTLHRAFIRTGAVTAHEKHTGRDQHHTLCHSHVDTLCIDIGL